MTDIDVQTPDGTIDAALEVPAGDGPWPGVVVVQDIAGLSKDIRNITRRIADNGYLAIAPNLYARGGALRCLRTVFGDLFARRGRTFDDIMAARDLLRGRGDCTGSVGVVGFCMGGGFALVASTKGFDASAPFYPSIPPSYESMLTDPCPIVASYGKRDPVNIGNGPRLEKVLSAKGIDHDVKVYPGVGHAFANDLPGQPLMRVTGFGYNSDATDDAFARVFSFFDTRLR